MKRVLTLVIALCLILALFQMPMSIVAGAAEESAEKVIGVTYTITADGTNAEANASLYSLDFQCAPDSLLPVQTYGNGKSGRVVIKRDYTFKYEYAVSDTGMGLGNILMQERDSWWGPAENVKLTDKTETWVSGEIPFNGSLLSDDPSDVRSLHNISFPIKISGAVTKGKTYKVFYRNLRIVDGSGNTVYNIFDPAVTPNAGSLAPQAWGACVNCDFVMDVVDNPYTKDETALPPSGGEETTPPAGGDDQGSEGEGAEAVGDTIKVTFKFSQGAEGVEKTAGVSLFGWCADKYKDYAFNSGSKLAYEYMIPGDSVPGLGTIDFQGTNNHTINSIAGEAPSYDVYENTYTNSLDMTKIPGYKQGHWVTEMVTPHSAISYNPNDGWQNHIGHIIASIKTTAAVDTNKEYVVYFRNIRIVSSKGETECVIFDGAQDLVVEKAVEPKNAEISATKAPNPAKDKVVSAPKVETVIKVNVKFTRDKALQGKVGNISLFGYNAKDGAYLKKGDKIVYSVLLDRPIPGLGGLSYQENEHNGGFWYFYHNIAAEKGIVDQNGISVMADADLSKEAGNRWYNRIMPFYGNDERQVCHWSAEVNATASAVDMTKEYNVYYKDIYVLHEDGSKTVIFDGSQDVKPEALTDCNGIELSVTKVDRVIIGTSPATGEIEEKGNNSALFIPIAMICALAVLMPSLRKLRSK